MTPAQLVAACRCPVWLAAVPQERGLWRLSQLHCPEVRLGVAQFLEAEGIWPCTHYTVLQRATADTLHMGGEVVMEDTPRELRRHLPILIPARGRVLVSGLGLGCVVRGLLAKPEVEHVDVVEIDRDVIALAGGEFENDPRVTLHVGDALTIAWPKGARWDFAWHDVHASTSSELHMLHARLLGRYHDHVRAQGAWEFDRRVKRAWLPMLNSKRRQRRQTAGA